MPNFEHRAQLSDVNLAYDTYGPPDGPLVMCLHGFPDTSNTFRLMAPFFGHLGYRVVVPAMRGYAPSSLATSGDYHVSALADDANQLHEFLEGDERAVLVGHDWGAFATYVATNREPARWHRAIAMAVPPLAVVARSFARYEQLHASWYMFFFQSPLAENVVAFDDLAFLHELWRAWSPQYDPSNEFAPLREALTSPENLHAALGYYRSMFAPRNIDTRLVNLPSVPTLYLHGSLDGCFLASSLTDVLESLAPHSKFTLVENAGHFVHLEEPDVVHQVIEDFLSA
jgi:pimeloyl-ACP methyl ester carboxylesterase